MLPAFVDCVCLRVGLAAKRRYQRSRVGWTISALFFSPLFVFLLLVVLGPNPAPPQLRKLLRELEQIEDVTA
jgi:hypothetical protein